MLNKLMMHSFFVLFLSAISPISNAHNSDSHISETNKEIPQKQNEVRLQKTGNIFELVITIRPMKEPNTIIYLSDPDSNRPIGDAEIKMHANSSFIKTIKTDKKGIYQAELPLHNLSSLNLDIQKETFKEAFNFDNISIFSSNDFTGNWFIKIFVFLLILGGLGLAIRRKITTKVNSLFSIGTFLTFSFTHALGHGDDHNHNETKKEIPPQQNSQLDNYPHIIAISLGGIVIPKELQFHLGIITEKVSEKSIKGSIRLMGTIISDPSGYARLQSTQTARVINHPDYPLPLPGQAVKAGQVVLAVSPTLTTIESTDQKNALYKAESEITQHHLEVQRLEKLGQYAAKKDLENAKAELERALKQKDEILNQTFKPELLKSPIDGFISDFHVRPGEIVTSDKTIAEIVDPTKFLIEALVFDPDIANQIVGGYIFSPFKPDKIINVKILGVSPKVNREDQSIHIQLKPEKIDTDIKLDMAVEVVGELKETKPTLVIPQKAITEDSQGTWVFIHTNPETFEPRKIRIRRQIDNMVEIEEGLSLGEKIVVEGTYLLNQAK